MIFSGCFVYFSSDRSTRFGTEVKGRGREGQGEGVIHNPENKSMMLLNSDYIFRNLDLVYFHSKHSSESIR